MRQALPSKLPPGHRVAAAVNQKGGDAMMTIMPEAETLRELRQEPRQGDLFDTLLNQTGARSHTRKVDGLTCSEAQVEAILSEGEST